MGSVNTMRTGQVCIQGMRTCSRPLFNPFQDGEHFPACLEAMRYREAFNKQE
jgi:hypothetical protein